LSFILQRASGRGFALTQFRDEVLRIGRGTNAELRSENPAVALEHAIIEADAAGWTIIDKGSITGTYVNGRPVEAARLAKGDVIEIGDLRIEVQTADAGKPMFLRVASTDRPVAAFVEEEVQRKSQERAAVRGGSLRAPEIDFAGAYRLARPYFTRVTLIAILMIIALVAISQVVEPDNQRWFRPGDVSSAHARHARNGKPIANDCIACHDPWHGVNDQNCKVCHTQGPHAMNELAPPGCVDCHAEHRDSARLSIVGDAVCINCHRDLTRHMRPGTTPSVAARVSSFAMNHPEFPPHVDRNTLRFNHKKHLQPRGIQNATGRREVLTCVGCHKLVEIKGKIDPGPIEFEQHCQRCHLLTFDLRYPKDEVPHGGSIDLVYSAVLTKESGMGGIAQLTPEARRLVQMRAGTSEILRSRHLAEQVIEVACRLCHEIRKDGLQLVATPPVMATSWFDRVKFTHTQHRIECISCHDLAPTSTMTKDVLLPSRAACTQCHGKSETKVGSCGSCHEYHERTK